MVLSPGVSVRPEHHGKKGRPHSKSAVPLSVCPLNGYFSSAMMIRTRPPAVHPN